VVSRTPRDDWDLLLIGGATWLAGVARVTLALAHHEVFGAEATLALACVVGIPWLLLGTHFSANAR